MKIFNSKSIAPALGHYNHAVISNNVMYLSGQIGINKDQKLVSSKTDEQAKQCFENVKMLLEDANQSIDNG
ncbi:hypothetical protein A3Q56_08127 [Intoshia linei]|uniref:Uncharacterized protein n=1 Tax=Intoshia linei TaxID=1819745 RepID=A0A177AQ83_9BILA|nr:hypothetical protein A3Q56_08127 [Intoshia linei]